MNEQQTLHRIELLEAEIRRLRQSLRILSNAVLAGSGEGYTPEQLALAVKRQLGELDECDQAIRLS